MHDLDPGRIGDALGIALAPRADGLLSRDADLRRVASADGDAATAIADHDARVGRDRLGRHIDIEAVGVAEDRLVDFDARDAILYEIGQGDEPDQAQQSENQKDFAGANGRTRLRPGALRGDAFIELRDAPKNQEQRPPVDEEAPKGEAAAEVVQEEEETKENQHESAENRAATWVAVGHARLLALAGRRRIRAVSRGGSCGLHQFESADDKKDHRPGVAEREVGVPAPHVQQKKHAEGNEDCGPHETPAGATRAGAAALISHRKTPFRTSG